ncbi:hypothetical protein HELRODRAFT_153023, partial [Helobdella robusta]|uniref:Syntaxin 6/10/61 N-terminal domain-containing protein n=1 Tax=Helobdella robusta TaxID=6412 RepID=T1EKY7_HELRO
MEDPFFVVREEVQRTIDMTINLFYRWCDLTNEPSLCSKEEYDWTTNELKNCLRSIEWDLEDLDETINIL